MVKKIRIIEDDPTTDEISDDEFKAKILEYLHAIDWKLWEMLKIQQAEQPTEEAAVTAKPKNRTLPKNIKPIIVVNDDDPEEE